MSIAIVFNNKDPFPWQQALKSKLPEIDIEIYPDIADYERVSFALCWKAPTNSLTHFPNLRVAQSVGASAEHILTHQKLSDVVHITRIVDQRLSQEMFEYILAGIMTHLRDLSLYYKQATTREWTPRPYKTIEETTTSLLGLGQIGTHVATHLAQLGFKVKGWSRSRKMIEQVECHHGQTGLLSTLTSTDILINLLPLTTDTENLLNREHLSLLNRGALLINVGRGEHLVETDLLDLLDNRHLSGALLDVFRQEPLPANHPFWTHTNIIITPHIASLTNIASATDQIVSNYRRWQKGQELLNIVSKSKGY